MKKIVALLMILCLALACVPALAVSPAEVLGDWYLCYREDGDNLIPCPTANVKLTFNRDSTVNISFEGAESTSEWKLLSDRILINQFSDGNQLFCDMTENGLSAYLKDEAAYEYSATYYFGHEPVEAEVFPEPIVASQEDDFFGEWVYDYSVKAGARFPAEEVFTAKIEFAQITLTDSAGNEYVALTDYVDGKLTANASDLGLAYSSENYKAVAQLANDGSLIITLEGEGADTTPRYMKRSDGSVVIPQPAEVVEEAAEAVEEAVEEVAEAVEEAVEEAAEASDAN